MILRSSSRRTPLPTLKAYLTFHYLSDHAPYLPKRFDDARFAFYGTTLRGQPQQRERWKRAVDEVNGALGELVGQLYVAQLLPAGIEGEDAGAGGESARRLERAHRHARVDDAGDEVARAREAGDLHPEDRLSRISGRITRRCRSGATISSATCGARPSGTGSYQVARLDKPVDRQEWQMTPQTINAYYNPLNNEIVFPAAILQPPFFDPNADAAVNYGGIGAVIGHEIGHGFDDQGRKFGPDGGLKDWWTQQDADVFKGRVTRLVNQFSAFEALPGLHVNGANTIGENIGDLGGLNMAYHAYQLSLQGPAGAGHRRAHRRSALLPVLGAGVAREVSATGAARARDVGRAQPAVLPCERAATQHRRLVQGVQCAPGRQALYQARGSRLDLVNMRRRWRAETGAAQQETLRLVA